MNAGAQGSCTGDILQVVTAIPLKGGEAFEMSNKELQFAYRQSILQREQLIVLSVRFQLEPGHNREELTQQTNANLMHRTSTQPYHLPSCGSVFRNPEPLKAGKLIESIGLKGKRLGGAEISKIHANFIVNQGQASAKDCHQLIKYIQAKVKETHSLMLFPEVEQLGFESND